MHRQARGKVGSRAGIVDDQHKMNGIRDHAAALSLRRTPSRASQFPGVNLPLMNSRCFCPTPRTGKNLPRDAYRVCTARRSSVNSEIIVRHRPPARRALAALAVAALLGVSVHAGAQPAPDATAVAVPVSGHIVITDMGKAETHIVPTPVVSSGSTTQREDLDITLPVLGLPLQGQASLTMEAHITMVLVSATTVAQGKADRVVLHGPAGDATVSIVIDQPVQGMGGYDPADATVHIRGASGTGMFDGVRIHGDLKGAFKPAGTLYLGYPSPEAALAAAERGLAQNTALTEPQRAALLDQARQALAGARVDLFPQEATAPPGQTAAPPAQATV